MWLGVTTLLYIVQYLIYKQFKMFYDINTMSGGAGDALTSYYKELLELIFLKGGLFVMILMCLPFVLNLVWGRRAFVYNKINGRNRIMSVATGALAHILALMLVMPEGIMTPPFTPPGHAIIFFISLSYKTPLTDV